MSQLQSPTKGFLCYSILYQSNIHSKEGILKHLELNTNSVLEPEFNPLTEYYSKEMGTELARFIVVDHTLREREELVPKKIWATDFENQHASENKRSINLDVGFLCLENFILATGKPYTHRVYLSEGVYAELTYYFNYGKFHVFDWTYPDYVHDEKVEFFEKERKVLQQLLKDQ